MFKGWKGTLLYLLVIAAAFAVLLSFWLAGRADASAEEGVRLPILMYHDITDNPLEAGDYVLTAAQLEEDLRALKENGWTPVSVSEVLRYVREGGQLPDKPVLLIFDDGYRSFLTRALPLLQAYDAPAAVSVIGRQAQRAGAAGGRRGRQRIHELGRTAGGCPNGPGGVREPLRRSARLLPTLRRGPSGMRE